jgi:hypothetical protein
VACTPRRSPLMASRQPHRQLLSTPFQGSSGECRVKDFSAIFSLLDMLEKLVAWELRMRWLKKLFQKHIIQDVPNELARCEFDCKELNARTVIGRSARKEFYTQKDRVIAYRDVPVGRPLVHRRNCDESRPYC